MTAHLKRDLENLKKEILTMGSMVETAVNKAISALINRRLELAEEVLKGDNDIDNKELEVEDQCLKILALHQPVAADLRFTVAVLKVNNDLERMGDFANHIAERAVFLSQSPPLDFPFEIFKDMASRVRGMVNHVLDAFVSLDSEAARKVIADDDEVDELHWRIYEILMSKMKIDPSNVERVFSTMSASRHLERIGDLATNIGEDVVFMVEGETVRHKFKLHMDKYITPGEG
jgi:phosphate transport system protein